MKNVIVEIQKIVKKYPVLDRNQEIDLFIRLQEGDIEARKLLILHNLCLVLSQVNKVNARVDKDELVSAGVLGLGIAIDKYDLSRGTKFSTYAYHWVRSMVQKEVQTLMHTIKKPYSAFVLRNRVLQLLNAGVPVSEIHQHCNGSPKQVSTVLTAFKSPLSLDMVYDDGSSIEPEYSEHDAQKNNAVKAVFELPEPYRSLIVSNYSLADTKHVNTVAKELGVPKDKIEEYVNYGISMLRDELGVGDGLVASQAENAIG